MPKQLVESLLLFAPLVLAQSPDSPKFEAASVRLAAPLARNEGSGMRRGGPTTDTPQLMSWRRIRLFAIIQQAYEMRTIQIVAPAWATQSDDAYYDINVSLPAGATQDDVRIMLRSLLAERFGLKVHRESKELDGFALVEAKGGSKLAKFPTKNATPAPMSLSVPLPTGVDFHAMSTTMQSLAQIIEGMEFQNQQPVVDKTGIAGSYDITFQYAPANSTISSNLPSLRTALEETLGLSLQKAKVPVEMLIVDRLEHTPTEN